MDCVIYIRWSSSEQGRGSSLERQRADCVQHASANGWNVTDELIDDGISAFKGAHASTGALGGFVRSVEAGRYPDGVVLLCEKLDRLSRQEPGRVFLWMMEMTEAGVIVATVDGNRQYSRGKFDMAAIIEVVVKAQLSHEESEKKSQRLGAAWAAKRKRLASGEKFVMSRRTPAWLKVVGSPPRFEVIPERAKIVHRVFEETVAGLGKHHIARNLNLDGIPTFGRAEGWHASYIQKILKSSAVLGDFQPGRKARGSKRELIGDVIVGYYPAVIDADLYSRAMASMADRARSYTGRGRKLANLLSGLARCEHCNAKMTFRGKGKKQRATGEWVNEDYLICDSYQRGLGCKNGFHFNYGIWVNGILDPIIFEAFDEQDFAPQTKIHELEIELADRDRRLTMARKSANAALDLAIDTRREEVKVAWQQRCAIADALEKEVANLKTQLSVLRGQTDPKEHQRRIEILRASLDSSDEEKRFEARTKIMTAVHKLVLSLNFTQNPTGVTMQISGGRTITIHYDEIMHSTDWVMYPHDSDPL